MVWLGFSMVALAAALIWSGVRTVNRGIEQERAAHGGIREAAQPDLGTAIWETIKKMLAILMDKDSPSWKRTMAWGAVQLCLGILILVIGAGVAAAAVAAGAGSTTPPGSTPSS